MDGKIEVGEDNDLREGGGEGGSADGLYGYVAGVGNGRVLRFLFECSVARRRCMIVIFGCEFSVRQNHECFGAKSPRSLTKNRKKRYFVET